MKVSLFLFVFMISYACCGYPPATTVNMFNVSKADLISNDTTKPVNKTEYIKAIDGNKDTRLRIDLTPPRSKLDFSFTFQATVISSINLLISSQFLKVYFELSGLFSKWHIDVSPNCPDNYLRRKDSVYTQCVSSKPTILVWMNNSYNLYNDTMVWWDSFTNFSISVEGNSSIDLTEISISGWSSSKNSCNCFMPGVRNVLKPCDDNLKCFCLQGLDEDRCMPCSTTQAQLFPGYGPVGGYQVVSLSKCLMTDTANIFLGSKICTKNTYEIPTTYSNGTSIPDNYNLCFTSQFDNTDIGKDLPVEVHWETGYLLIDGISFTPRENPVISLISRNGTIESGGLSVTITGQNLDVFPNPYLYAICSSNTCYSGSSALLSNTSKRVCKIINTTYLVCNSPKVIKKFEYYYSLTVNPKSLLLNLKIKLCFDPNIPQMNPKTENYPVAERPKYIKLLGGSFQTSCVDQSDYAVYVGNVKVEDFEVLENTLIFLPPATAPPKSPSDENGASEVKVTIGDITEIVGYIQYNPPIDAAIIIGSVLGSLGFLLIVFFIIFMILIKKKKMLCFKEKTHSEDYAPRLRLIEMLNEPLKSRVKRCRVPEDALVIGSEVGKGNFGKVFYGKYKDTEVAVKTLSGGGQSVEYKIQFLEEAVMMMDFNHENVLSLVAITIDDKDIPRVVLPYMKNGDLRTFLLNDKIHLEPGILLSFIQQVACGMEYLALKKFVHRDLAARNCMVDENMVVKVADFGLARDIYHEHYYKVKSKETPLPYKWMAMECLNGKLKFSEKTDVWSFGILMWEVFTKGESPYFELNHSKLKHFLRNGQRLEIPPLASKEIYQIMCSCWNVDPDLRPTFSGLKSLLENPDMKSDGEFSRQNALSRVGDEGYLVTNHNYDNQDQLNLQLIN